MFLKLHHVINSIITRSVTNTFPTINYVTTTIIIITIMSKNSSVVVIIVVRCVKAICSVLLLFNLLLTASLLVSLLFRIKYLLIVTISVLLR